MSAGALYQNKSLEQSEALLPWDVVLDEAWFPKRSDIGTTSTARSIRSRRAERSGSRRAFRQQRSHALNDGQDNGSCEDARDDVDERGNKCGQHSTDA